MKKIYFIVFFLFLVQISFAQDSFAKVEKAISLGSAKELVPYFDKLIELNLDGAKGSFNKDQADYKLKTFFRDFPPTSFSFIHSGSSSGGQLKYSIGTYQTAKASYRVLIRFKKSGESYLVYNLSFTKE